MKETEQAVLEIKVQDARQRFLDKLYVQAGRDKKDSPMHCLYTGLYQEYVATLEES